MYSESALLFTPTRFFCNKLQISKLLLPAKFKDFEKFFEHS